MTGEGTVLLVRRSASEGITVRAAVNFRGDRQDVVLDAPDQKINFSELGALHFDVLARSSDVTLERAEWVAVGADPDPVRLVAGYCTFNREKFLLDNVQALLEDPALADVLERVVVVDQGTSRVRSHPAFGGLPPAAGSRLHLVEQGNFGGAGGVHPVDP